MTIGAGPIGAGPIASDKASGVSSIKAISATLSGVGTLTADFFLDGTASARVSQFSFETLSAGSPVSARLSSLTLETLNTGNADLKISSVNLQALTSGDASIITSFVALEVLRGLINLNFDYVADINLTGIATLNANAIIYSKLIDTALTGVGTLTGAISVLSKGEATLIGSGSLSTSFSEFININANLTGAGTMVTIPGPLTFKHDAALIGTETLKARILRLDPDGIADNSGYIYVPSLVKRVI